MAQSTRPIWLLSSFLVLSASFLACSTIRTTPEMELEGWQIESVEDRGAGCLFVRYLKPATWDCSPSQLDAAEGWPSRNMDGGDDGSVYDSGDAGPTVADLEQLDCDTLIAERRQLAVNYEVQQLAEQYQTQLSACLDQHTTRYFQDGAETSYCAGNGSNDASIDGDAGGYDDGYSGGDDAGVPTGSEDGANSYSTTNNQVRGVEEADYVKNDSGHIYLLTPHALEVFDAWPVAEAKRLTRIEFESEPRRLLLAGDTLVVLLRTGVTPGTEPSQQGCTYGYGCSLQGEGGGTEVLVFDVSDPAHPVQKERFGFSGAYVAARRIGQRVVMVVEDRLDAVPTAALLGLTIPADVSADTIDAAYAARVKEAGERMQTVPEAAFLPVFGSVDPAKGCDGYLRSQGSDMQGFVSVVTIDLAGLGAPHFTSIGTVPGFVYASSDALYLATPVGYTYYEDGSGGIDETSIIHKFAIDGTAPEYRGSASLRGHVLNQFAMDELDGVLRVASTNGYVPSANVSSSLTTFHELNGHLSRYGELSGLAPTEDIRSVRFDGDRAFVVTFKKTDPLFAFDLSNPAAPRVLGELKIPGFSTYMHPIDRDHLLAVGYDADDQGSFAYFNGIQVQIFDISNLAAPLLAHKMVIGTRGSSSEALTNHLAFNYFPAEKVLALPITICEGGGNGTYGDTMTFSGLLALDVDLTNGISERGRLPFASPTDAADLDYGAAGCFGWWTESTSTVKRSIFFEDYLYGISTGELRAAQLDALGSPLVSLPIGE